MSDKPAEHIAALVERIGRLLSTDAHAEGLLPVQWEALRYLNKANRFSRSPAELTAYLGLTKGTVSQSISTLEARGLVEKQVNQKDRRSKHLSLTKQGAKLLLRDPLHETVSAIEQLTDSAQQSLTTNLQSILRGRLEARGRQPFGQCRDCKFFAIRHPDGSPHYCKLLREALAKSDALAICVEQIPS